MTQTRIIGLTGKLGSGKDEVLKRLQVLHGAHVYRKASFAALLKESAAALLNITVEQLEVMKNEPHIRVALVDLKGAGRDLGRSFSMREILQRYGTEAHRDVFGDDFWVRAAIENLRVQHEAEGGDGVIWVFTDVRFENEARAIRELGGHVYEVVGYNRETGDHASEAGIPEGLIEWGLDNTYRPDIEAATEGRPDDIAAAQAEAVKHLDDEVTKLHAELHA